ncbi:MAG: universal stress protein [Candidatus Hydrothermarchaeales archaeon]
MKTILTPVDGSSNSDLAVEESGILAKKFDAKVILLHVAHTETSFSRQYEDEYADETSISYMSEVDKKEADEILERGEKILEEMGVKPETAIRMGEPANEILEFATEYPVDYIVMGSRGLSGIKKFLMGSVSSRVMEHSHCSVLIVKGEKKTPDIEVPLSLQV